MCVLAWIAAIIQKPLCNNKQQTRGLADPSSSNRQLCGPETTIYQQSNVSGVHGSSGLRPTVRVNWARPSRLKHLVYSKTRNEDCRYYLCNYCFHIPGKKTLLLLWQHVHPLQNYSFSAKYGNVFHCYIVSHSYSHLILSNQALQPRYHISAVHRA